MEIPLGQIAELVGGTLEGDPALLIHGVNALDQAREGELSFFADPRLEAALKTTRASAVILPQRTSLYSGAQVICPHPDLALAKVAGAFVPPLSPRPGVSDRAVIRKSAVLGRDVSVFPLVYVGENVRLGDRVVLFPGVVVGDGVRIGDDTVVHPNVTILRDCRIGRHVTLHAGTVVGGDGYGYVREGGKAVKIPQTGRVIIEDDVEIGCGNCIDRATFGETVIRRGVKTDNLVQIGHNVVVGEDSLIVAQVGVSGSVRIGREVTIGGQVGIKDHVEVGDRVMIGPQSGVAKSVPEGSVITGWPAVDHKQWLRTGGYVRRLPGMNDRLRELEKRVAKLERVREAGDNPDREPPSPDLSNPSQE